MKKCYACIISVAVAVAGLSGCANMSETQKGTATGAGVGAAAGAVIGGVSGGNRTARAGTGAVVGAAIGAGVGYLWSQRMQEQKQAMEQATKGTGVAVTQTADNQRRGVNAAPLQSCALHHVPEQQRIERAIRRDRGNDHCVASEFDQEKIGRAHV